MKRPADIKAAIQKSVNEDVERHMKMMRETHPTLSVTDLLYEEYIYLWLSEWWHELPDNMSDDDARRYLGIPVPDPQIVVDKILSQHRTGWTVGEMTGLELVDNGGHYEVALKNG